MQHSSYLIRVFSWVWEICLVVWRLGLYFVSVFGIFTSAIFMIVVLFKIGFGNGKKVLADYDDIFRDGIVLFFDDCIPTTARNDQPGGSFAPAD